MIQFRKFIALIVFFTLTSPALAQQLPVPPTLAAKSWLLLGSGALLLGARQLLKRLSLRSPS